MRTLNGAFIAPEVKLTDRDIAHLRASLDAFEDSDDGYECVMTSIGSVELWADGSVYAHVLYLGCLGNVLDDDDIEDCDNP